jgi:hypothetical protein
MPETIWETPIPYFLFSAVVGGVAALTLVAFKRSLKALLVAPVVAGAVLIALVDAGVEPSLTAENRIALLACAFAGTPFGIGLTLSCVWYQRWISTTFERAEERLRSLP